MRQEEPRVGELNKRFDYPETFFVKSAERLGDNMFLLTYTQDRKGHGVRRTGVFFWATSHNNGVYREGWLGIAHVRRRQSNDRITLRISDWMMPNRQARGVYASFYFDDTDEQFDRAKRTAIGIVKAWYPDEFYGN